MIDRNMIPEAYSNFMSAFKEPSGNTTLKLTLPNWLTVADVVTIIGLIAKILEQYVLANVKATEVNNETGSENCR